MQALLLAICERSSMYVYLSPVSNRLNATAIIDVMKPDGWNLSTP